MSSKKTVLKVTPIAPAPSQQKVKRKHDYLRECINSIVKRELLQLNFNKVVGILDNDLHINLKNITPRLKHILYECLCYYMRTWPGWKNYDVVCINERAKMDYYDKFKEYLSLKMNYIIENESKFYADVLNDEDSTMSSKEIQTDPINKSNKPEAPYNLVISGQPNVLNNIVFIEMDNNIVIKQHAEKPWKPLNLFEFLNYSFVYVSIKLPEIELSRSNLHEFQRYITESGDIASCPDVDFITYIRRQSSSKPKVYTMDYVHAYFRQLLEIIRKAPGVNPIKKTELEEIFRQFILDIQESNVFSCTDSAGKEINTMATDTSVCFNIGRRTYIRNKKMVVNNDNQKQTNAINFCEVLIPRMAYTLNKFTAREDVTTSDTSFRNLNEINIQIDKNSPELYKFIEAVNNCITYQCLLCPKVYSGDRAYIDILDHYRFLHKGEQSVLCFICRKQFLISKLAGSRWSHQCIDGDSGVIKETNDVINDSNIANIETPSVTARPSIGINDILASSQVTHPIIPTGPNIIFGINQVPSTTVKKPDSQPVLLRPSTEMNESLTNTNITTLSIDNLLGNQNKGITTSIAGTSNHFKDDPGIHNRSNTTYANATIINTGPIINASSLENNVFPAPGVLLTTPDFVASTATTLILSNPVSSNSNMTIPLTPATFTNIIPSDIGSDLNVVKTEPDNIEPVIMEGVAESIPNANLTSIANNVLETNSLINSMNYGSFTSLSMTIPPAVDNMTVFPPVVTTPVSNVLSMAVEPNTNMNTNEVLVPSELPVIVTSTSTSQLINPLTAVLTTPMSSVYLS